MNATIMRTGFALVAAALLGSPATANAGWELRDVRIDFPSPSDNPALEKVLDDRGWHYDTDYLFGVTRGLRDAGAPSWRPALWIFTIPFDVANLPVAAIAGLFGD